jgi:hypothetical protein
MFEEPGLVEEVVTAMGEQGEVDGGIEQPHGGLVFLAAEARVQPGEGGSEGRVVIAVARQRGQEWVEGHQRQVAEQQAHMQRRARDRRETIGEHRLVHVRRATEIGVPRIEAEVLDDGEQAPHLDIVGRDGAPAEDAEAPKRPVVDRQVAQQRGHAATRPRWACICCGEATSSIARVRLLVIVATRQSRSAGTLPGLVWPPLSLA